MMNEVIDLEKEFTYEEMILVSKKSSKILVEKLCQSEIQENNKIADFSMIVNNFTRRYMLPAMDATTLGITQHASFIIKGINLLRHNPSLIRSILLDPIFKDGNYSDKLGENKVIRISKIRIKYSKFVH